MSDDSRNKIYGYPAALILRDEVGEFQIVDAVRSSYGGNPSLDWNRIRAAIQLRTADVGPPKRPKY